jgi:hypothetical protein
MAKKPWEEAAEAGTTSASMLSPWEEAAAGEHAAAAPPHRQPPTTWTQDRQKETAPGAHPLWDKITQYQEPDFSHPIDAAGKVVGNLGGGLIKAVGDMAMPGGTISSAAHGLMHPQESAKSLVEAISGKPYDPGDASIMPDARRALHVGNDMVTQAAALAPVAATTGPAISSVGRGIKGAGRIAGELTLGTDAVDRATARPGAGLSENRVVGMSRPSLLNKVNAKIEPLKDAETDVLSRHNNRGPIDSRSIVNDPFLETIGRTTDYRTGAGSRPEMGSHWNTLENLNYVQDPKGGLLRDPITQQPVPKAIDAHTPVEAAKFKSNIYRMTNYDDAASGLANNDLKRAGGKLKAKIQEVVPESIDATEKLHNTEAAADVLQRQRGLSLAGNPLSKSKLLDMVRVPVGSSAAALLDLVGSGVTRVGNFLTPRGSGGGQPTATPANPPTPGPAPRPVVPAGNLPAPRPPLPQGQPLLNAGHIVTPPPAPTLQLPGAVQGPLTRVVTRVGGKFGPKVEAPAFSKPVGRYGGDEIMSPEAERRNAADNNKAREDYQNRRKGDRKK